MKKKSLIGYLPDIWATCFKFKANFLSDDFELEQIFSKKGMWGDDIKVKITIEEI